MSSHLGAMVLFALFVSVVFATLMRDDPAAGGGGGGGGGAVLSDRPRCSSMGSGRRLHGGDLHGLFNDVPSRSGGC